MDRLEIKGPERIEIAVNRLFEDLKSLTELDSSYWNATLGVNHLKCLGEQIQNDAKTLGFYLKTFGEK